VSTAIHVASRNDARAIAMLRTAVAQGMTRQYGFGHWSACPSKAEVLKQMRASHMLVARCDSRIIGTVRLATANPLAFDSGLFTPVQTALYVLGLAVAPEWRKQGIGRELMEAAKAEVRSRPAEALWLDTYDNDAGAGPFYLHCDFRRVGATTRNDLSLIYYEWLARRASE
jgi:ribosomal protein S18 acetylase RimI-like enzyme